MIAGEGSGALRVTVVLRREERQRGRWRFPYWTLGGILAGDHGGEPGALAHSGDGVSEYVWPGLPIRLLASQAETYWYNLTGTDPAVFVVCREDTEGGMIPLTVTLDQDEATRQIEGDGEVFRAAIPGELQERLERFVMDHYQPQQPKRRRRKPDEQH